MLQLTVKCWYSALNAQGSRLIIVIVQLGAVKIYVVAMEALKKKERQDETQFTTKIDGFLSFIPPWMVMYFFAGFFWISPCVWPNSGFWCCVFLTLRITLLCDYLCTFQIQTHFVKLNYFLMVSSFPSLY
jgi:hypothetical protein